MESIWAFFSNNMPLVFFATAGLVIVLFGGTLSIDSRHGSGTRIVAMVPLVRQEGL